MASSRVVTDDIVDSRLDFVVSSSLTRWTFSRRSSRAQSRANGGIESRFSVLAFVILIACLLNVFRMFNDGLVDAAGIELEERRSTSRKEEVLTL